MTQVDLGNLLNNAFFNKAIDDLTFEDFATVLGDVDFDKLVTVSCAQWGKYEYQGFDQANMLKMLLANAKAKGHSNEKLLRDMINCCAWFHVRGANSNNIKLSNTDGESIKDFTRMVGDYKIAPNSKGSNLSLSRISQIFPELSKRVFDKLADKAKVVITTDDIGLQNTKHLYPNYVPSFISITEACNGPIGALLFVHNAYSALLSKKTERATKGTLKEWFAKSTYFSHQAMKNSKISDATKGSTCKAWGKAWYKDTFDTSVLQNVFIMLDDGQSSTPIEPLTPFHYAFNKFGKAITVPQLRVCGQNTLTMDKFDLV